jgi:hypothetical protein
MMPTPVLSEQQVLTLYAVATYLTLGPVVLIAAGFLGILHAKSKRPTPASDRTFDASEFLSHSQERVKVAA